METEVPLPTADIHKVVWVKGRAKISRHLFLRFILRLRIGISALTLVHVSICLLTSRYLVFAVFSSF